MKTIAIILAAGQGTRMRSSLPKVLHPLLGRPMALYTLEAALQVTAARPVMVVGHGADQVRAALGDLADYVIQEPQLGTGHAVQQAADLLRGQADTVLVLAADMPLLTTHTLTRLVQAQQSHHGPLTMLTVLSDQSRGFGRVLRDPHGRLLAIVEQAQATPEQLAIRELNVGVYCFAAAWLWEALERVPLSPKGEYYLTDLLGIAVQDGLPVQALVVEESAEAIGVNNRLHLAEAEAILRQRINQAWMLAGVTLIDPASTYIEPGVQIGQDTVIWPNTYLQGHTVVGAACTLGPNTIIRDSQLGDRCEVLASVLEKAVLEDDVDIGPFARLRTGAHLAQGVHMGNFGEIKNAYLGPGTKMGHFSYVGDATIGPQVNIGAGTVFCNYDGEHKHHTEIGAGVFIGSDTMLVAPLKIGDGARTGAGSVVTKDVPENSLAVGIPARVIRKMEKRD
ncbi:MAG: bifunctional UDP-N-acetylglucosamine diphosphorylase/glucosamine-1-phosphate N-acetyltransferase GlmU [Anaerolineales bacterium]|nr:MAG: bifunctional UDP-N-acetylglucosamine diphosphorylase/glucosamine-1-phosphate N-acetyltransferase GlmU [Anaerolineales bacterium]